MRVVLKGKSLVQYIDRKVDNIVADKQRAIDASEGSGQQVTPAPEGSLASGVATTPSIGSYGSFEEWKDAQYVGDARAMGIIMTHVGPDQLSLIESRLNAHEQWESLRRTYQPTGATQLVALLAAFHGYTLRANDTVDTASARLTTIQTDIRSVDAAQTPTDQAKAIKLMDLFARHNKRYEPVVLILQGRDPFPNYQNVVSDLARMEERVKDGNGNGNGSKDLALSAKVGQKGKGKDKDDKKGKKLERGEKGTC